MDKSKIQDLRVKGLKVLVTGGAGFIGSNLCEYLLDHGAAVVCLDNLSTGHKKNITPFLSNPNFKFIEGDIRDLDICVSSSFEMDYILHQAALGSVPRSIDDPITTNSVNINGFLNMLIAARDNKVKRFIYAASSSTYGDSIKLPKLENEIGTPLSPYAITKYVNELYAGNFKKIYGLNSIGLRYFNVFGKRQDPNGAYAAVIPLFVKKMIKGESPVINGDGSFSRDFTYIENVIEMNILAMSSKDSNAINQIYNTACGDRTTLNQLGSYLKEYLSIFDSNINGVEMRYGPSRRGDIPHSLASIDKAYKLLGYKPLYTVKEGIEKTVKWYFENLI